MKLLFLLASAALLYGQETRHTLVHPAPDPAADSRPNSDQVPDVMAIPAHLDRLVIFRFKYKTDVLAGLQKMVKQENIQNAVILAGLGSVRGYHIHQVGNRTFPARDIFERDPTAPCDLVSMNGYVIDGRIHAHMTLAQPGKALGGHLEPGTEVFTFVVVTMAVLKDTELKDIDSSWVR